MIGISDHEKSGMKPHLNEVEDVPLSGLVERIDYAISIVGGFEKVSEVTDTSVRQIHRYRAGAAPSTKFIQKLAEASNLSAAWLLEGDDAANEAKAPAQTSGRSGDIVEIPVVNVSASAGGGSLVMEGEEPGFIAFSRLWIEQAGLSPKQLFTLPSVGESMEPTIHAGEYLLCSSAEHHIKPGDGIYVVRLDGHILVKRLQVLPQNRLKVTCDNGLYEPYEIKLEDGVDFAILGKVVFVHGIRRI
ncbi:MAG: hypothetical protein GC185_01690 [Alphaproteobacteria bacterium]|nr:hypothetical protein [Alphaproteobacteria bacterium]